MSESKASLVRRVLDRALSEYAIEHVEWPDSVEAVDDLISETKGLSRPYEQRTGHSREYWRYRFAGQALAGALADPTRYESYSDDAMVAVCSADATLAALEADDERKVP